MDEHSLRVLEFYKVREILAGYAASEPGMEEAGEVLPSADPDLVRRSLKETDELKSFLDAGSDFPVSGTMDIRAALKKSAAEGAVLQPAELLSVLSTARASRLVKGALTKAKDASPLLYRRSESLGVFEELESEIRRAIGEDGEILDSASSELKRIRRGMTQLRARINKELEHIIQDPSFSRAVQEPVITVRGDRYVLPLKPNFKMYLQGIVHDHSASRSTVFVEPEKTVELNNRLARLRLDEKREEERVLWQLTGLVRRDGEPLGYSLAALAGLDVIYAKASYAHAAGAHMPKIITGGVLELRKARHPLLLRAKGEGTVPQDIALGKGYTTLVVTGPNTGGKTVALKTVGLLVLMAQSGMLIPAAPDSEMSVFGKVYSDIGDEQSVEQNLSTFSSHMTQIVRILGDADKASLVLLDEVGAGTDPAEGSALGVAILDELHRRGCRVIATTHHGALKVFAENTDGVMNSSVEFDTETLMPTYRLLVGRPGRSNALLVAERLGMPASVIESAKKAKTQDEVQLDRLIERLEKEARAADEDRNRAALELLKARQENERLKRLAGQADRELIEVAEKARQKASGVIRALRQKLRELEDLEKKRASGGAGADIRADVSRLRADVRELEAGLEPEKAARVPSRAVDIETLGPGDRVRVFRHNRPGTVVSVNRAKGRVVVEVGALKLTLGKDDLEPIDGPGGPGEAAGPGGPVRTAGPKKAAVTFSSDDQDVKESPFELNIIGMRVDEAEPLVEKFLDDCMMAGRKEVRIIHGRGTGALRKLVAGILGSHRGVSSFRHAPFDQGGDAVTEASMDG